MIRGLRMRRAFSAGRGERSGTPIVSGALADEVDGEIALPRVIGHRGAAASAPENTLAGLRQAKVLGCRWVEFDVRLTADGRAVLLHDNRLRRTTDGRGKLTELSLAAVRNYDAGGWFGPPFAGERVPTLEEAMALLAELGLGANVELKAASGREAETGAVVAGLLARLWPRDLPAPLISSFHRRALAAARASAPGIARGVLFRTVPRNWRAIADSLECTTIHADYLSLRQALASEIRGAGYPLLAYTVNDPGRAQILFDWGVTGVFSDAPRLLLDALARQADDHTNFAEAGSAGITGRGSAA
jgi:glycerophosphoryl diester phosphodiesterase